MPDKRITGQPTKNCIRCNASLRPWQRSFCSENCYQAGRWAALVARFRSRINKNQPTPLLHHELGPCWLWTGKPMPNGYGALGLDRLKIYTHRLAYELAHGPIPAGLSILHLCDVNYPPGDTSYRLCVRPEHLAAGTQGENVRHAVSSGRFRPTPPPSRARVTGDHCPLELKARGERIGRAFLTAADIREIRRDYATGHVEQRELAERFRTDESNISLIVRRKNWKHVE